ncbi:glycerophosphoryl diester phosphodiesterase [Phakopsora pachyrhizi]|uniref:Glycerophosphoryl diester phosphodiesterase n=1 Tax=Phakopsora pachyrhizi TaxID=170000 RepID=A0AAV0B0L5_PHAPC|nr:glycerophosphoryl diester phosphodiesterase [Phakopsora pachyrhizi]CAH7675156.1 glycerophosphoryl diester phosphodiesterase [Phakopsora pachyrhizi]
MSVESFPRSQDSDLTTPSLSEATSSSLDEPLPACWGHRGASAAFPENTLSSFEAAIRDGAEGIESDVHISSDDVICMFHDPSLERTTDGKGMISLLPYKDGIDNVRTLKAPHQKIPTFEETMKLIMNKENQHVVFNIDCKPENDPERLFRLIKQSIEKFEDHENLLSPRLVLGLWHPKFIEPSVRMLPHLRKSYIGCSPSLARKYFWDACDSFSMKFSCLVGSEGSAFRQACKDDSKTLLVWTVNDRQEMIEASKWGVSAILTDRTKDYLELRREMQDDWESISAETTALFPYSSIHYSSIMTWISSTKAFYNLTKLAGPFQPLTN